MSEATQLEEKLLESVPPNGSCTSMHRKPSVDTCSRAYWGALSLWFLETELVPFLSESRKVY